MADGLGALYPPEVAEVAAARLVDAAAEAFAERPADLARLDQVRTLRPDWFQSSGMVGYATYADRFAGDLAGVAAHIDHLRDLGVTYLHLLPLLATRPGDSDGGYAVADHRSVRPDLGTMDDLRDLARALRAAGISLVLDLVVNHVAREHPWAEAARAGDAHHRAFFLTFPDRTGPDAYEATLPEVFPDFAPGNFTWDDDLQAWVWTTFNAFQWDLDWANPEVLVAFAGIVFFLVNAGAEVLRLDALPFVWKRLGTDCQNQPEVHAVAAVLRALLRIVAPAVVLKAEAIVGPGELVRYLGAGRWSGRECDLAYHNTLMVQVWSTLASRDARLATQALRALPPKPAATAWATYVRGHDDIGWAVDDADAAAVGLDGFAHRAFLSDWYAGRFPGSPATGLVFQENPATGDRRISGTTASLAGAERAGDPGAQALVVGRILVAHAVVFGWGGIPVIWMGDEVAMVNDPGWADDPAHAGDNRWVHRPRMDWDLVARRDDDPVAGPVFRGLRHLARVRASLPQLHASVEAAVLDVAEPGVLAVRRAHPLGPLLGVYNFTESARSVPVPIPGGAGTDVLAGEVVSAEGVALAPYQARWIVAPT